MGRRERNWQRWRNLELAWERWAMRRAHGAVSWTLPHIFITETRRVQKAAGMRCQRSRIKVNGAKGKGPPRASARSWSASVTGPRLPYDHIRLRSPRRYWHKKGNFNHRTTQQHISSGRRERLITPYKAVKEASPWRMTYNAGYPTMKRIENGKSGVLLGWSRTSSRFRKAGYDSLTDSASHGEDKEGKSRVSALGASPHGGGAVSDGKGGSRHERKRAQAAHEHIWAGVRARFLTVRVTEFRKNLSVQCFTGW